MKKLVISLTDSELAEIVKEGFRKETIREILNRETVTNGIIYAISNQTRAMHATGELVVEECQRCGNVEKLRFYLDCETGEILEICEDCLQELAIDK
jgi:predicted small secreted protein